MRRFCCLAITLLVLFGAAVAQEREPHTAADYLHRGIARYDKGDHDGAIADYTKAIEINPRYARAYALRGLTKLEQGKDAEAQADIDTAIKLDSSLKLLVEEISNKIKQSRKPKE